MEADMPWSGTDSITVDDFIARWEPSATISPGQALVVPALRERRQHHDMPAHHNALDMVKMRALAAGLSPRICNHTFRATSITAYLEAGGTIEKAQRIAAHESPKTTKLYDCTVDQVSIDEIDRIVI